MAVAKQWRAHGSTRPFRRRVLLGVFCAAAFLFAAPPRGRTFVSLDQGSDGIGQQAVWLLLLRCRVEAMPGLEYAHAPVVFYSTGGHGDSLHSPDELAAAYELYLGIGAHARGAAPDSAGQDPAAVTSLQQAAAAGPGSYFISGRGEAINLRSPAEVSACIARARRRRQRGAAGEANGNGSGAWPFASPRPPRLSCQTPPCRVVALHVRRGDVSENAAFAGYGTVMTRYSIAQPEQWYLAVLAGLKACEPRVRHEVHVFSEGDEAQFPVLSTSPVIAALHLDGHSYDALDLMVRSDVLVVGYSSFSYLAGLMHEGALVVMPSPMWTGFSNTSQYRPAAEWMLADAQSGRLTSPCLKLPVATV